MTFDELNKFVSEIKLTRTSTEMVKKGSKGYALVGEPTIAPPNGSVFKLNPYSYFSEFDGVCEYVDRVKIPVGMSQENVSLIAELMQARANKKLSQLGEKIHVSHYGFQMPGAEGRFVRMLEDESGFELRFYMDVFREV